MPDSIAASLTNHLVAHPRGASRTLTRLVFLVVLAQPSLALRLTPSAIRGAQVRADEYDWRQVDERGDRLPDFSTCGYRANEHPIPTAPVRVVVRPVDGDDGARLQAALDHVSALEPDADGLRGAVLLGPGRYDVEEQLRIEASGIVLRGSGRGDDGTTIVATGPGRRTLLRVRGTSAPDPAIADDDAPGERHAVLASRVPVGSFELEVERANSFAPGDRVRIERPSTEAWIEALGMDVFGIGWRAGSRDIRWERSVVAVDENTLRLDAPLTTAIEARFGGASVRKCSRTGRIERVGVENLCLVSRPPGTSPNSEDHAWYALSFENILDAWVRQVDFAGFAGGAVTLWETAQRVTVEDCLAIDPISEIGGARRRTFHTSGQQTLFLRCWSERGIEDFTVGHCAAGPNAFVACTAWETHGDSGSIGSWASGVLFDNVRIDGGGLRLDHLWALHRGAGWSAANCVLWQCAADEIRCFRPPTAQNRAIGVWARFTGDGAFFERNDFVSPRSLFLAQLGARLGGEAVARRGPIVEYPPGTTNPRLEEAERMTARSEQPAPTVRDLVLAASRRTPIPSGAEAIRDASSIEDVLAARPRSEPEARRRRLELRNGWLLIDGSLALGRVYRPMWWRGTTRPDERIANGHAITRFVPGREGQGFTDELPVVADALRTSGHVGLEHHHGLWYDRRRDDHQRVRRRDGAVEPPFYEMPFARSGTGTAWDGLSRYDLTRFNPWYWSRLEAFADLCESQGLVLLQQHYFQHQLLEAGAHWADAPWRSANNINDTGFPEPVPYAGDKRIFQADLFYDVDHPARRALHRGYIRQCLSALGERSNVLHLTGAEFTGPLAFVEFWIDTIVEWKRETGRDALVVLSVTRDVQDAVLVDPGRAPAISAIDVRHWWYHRDGELYAPEGGRNLAPRQFQRLLRPGRSSFDETVRAVRELRDTHPEKAVITSVDGFDPWAVLIAGGSFPALGALPATLRESIPRMAPTTHLCRAAGVHTLERRGEEALVHTTAGGVVELDLSRWSGAVIVRALDPSSLELSSAFAYRAGPAVSVATGSSGPIVLWLRSESAEREAPVSAR